MALSIFVGSPHQHQTIANLAKLIDLGERYGIPVIAVTAVGKDMVRDARYLALASRIAAEMGAHIVKTYYVEDDFERITGTCPVPVVMAGGKKLPEREALEMTYNAMARGAAGVDMGRNIFQSDSPIGMIKAVRAVVHGDAARRRRVRGLHGREGDERHRRPPRPAASPTTARSRRAMQPTNRVAVYRNNSDIRIEERDVPAIGPDEILVRVRASGHLRLRRHGVVPRPEGAARPRPRAGGRHRRGRRRT